MDHRTTKCSHSEEYACYHCQDNAKEMEQEKRRKKAIELRDEYLDRLTEFVNEGTQKINYRLAILFGVIFVLAWLTLFFVFSM